MTSSRARAPSFGIQLQQLSIKCTQAGAASPDIDTGGATIDVDGGATAFHRRV